MANALLLGVLPMVNVLAGVILIGDQHSGSRPFLMGFVAFGVMALALCVALIFHDSEPLNVYVGLLFKHWGMVLWHSPSSISACVTAVWLGLPKLAFALLGGFLSRRFYVIIVRR
jgi:hypothetical protein